MALFIWRDSQPSSLLPLHNPCSRGALERPIHNHSPSLCLTSEGDLKARTEKAAQYAAFSLRMKILRWLAL
jgi:hypothetical protein